jgi:hypothetical protein
MIYTSIDSASPIRQGDIFRGIPRVDLDLSNLNVVAPDGNIELDKDWSLLVQTNSRIAAVTVIRPVYAIVITQDCDAVRIDDVALCEIDRFVEVEKLAKNAGSPKSLMSIITKHARVNNKWFYLPSDPAFGFIDKMAVDFQTVIPASRTYLETHAANLRIGRLNEVASAHFRERLSDFFRRYPYDEWYSLDKAEFEAYKQSKPEPISPFAWQT